MKQDFEQVPGRIPRQGEEDVKDPAQAGLQALREVSPLPAEALAADRRRFLAEAARLRLQHEHHRLRAKSGAARLRGRLPWAEPMGRPRRLPRVLATMAAVLLLALAALTATVATAQSAGPESPLYGIKLAWEDVRLALAIGAPSRAELALSFAETRMAEAEALVGSNRSVPTIVARRLEANLRQALREALRLTDAEMNRFLLRIQLRTEQHAQVMERWMAATPGQKQEALRLMIATMAQTREMAALGLSDPAAFRRAGDAGFASVPMVPPGSTPTNSPAPHATPGPNRSTVLPTSTQIGPTPQATGHGQPTHTPLQQQGPPPTIPGGPKPPENTPGPPQPPGSTPSPPDHPDNSHGGPHPY